jgi:hypothetical protein
MIKAPHSIPFSFQLFKSLVPFIFQSYTKQIPSKTPQFNVSNDSMPFIKFFPDSFISSKSWFSWLSDWKISAIIESKTSFESDVVFQLSEVHQQKNSQQRVIPLVIHHIIVQSIVHIS